MATKEDMNDLVVRRSRPRANTQDVVLALPSPEADPVLYTEKRLTRGIDYVTARRAERVVSNPTNNLLTLYDQACHAAIAELQDGREPEEIGHLLDEVRHYELEMSNKHWAIKVLSHREEEMVERLLSLRKTTFHARYGDYFSQIAKKLRSTAWTYKTDHWKFLVSQPYWTVISTKLKEEKKYWDRNGSTYPDEVPVTLSIFEACKYLSVDYACMFTVIHLYAERNATFHRGLDEAIEAKQYNKIAQWLYQDLKELPNLVPLHWEAEESAMKSALLALRDMWFDISEAPEEPLSWGATTELKNVAKSHKQKNDEALDQHIANVARRAAELHQQGLEKESLLAQASLEPEEKLPSLPADISTMATKPKSKRKASSPLESKVRKQAFWDVLHQFQGAHQSYDSTVQRQRAANSALAEYRMLYSSTP